MAQTKRKRSTKHRGNAAGMIETRGRTGRKPEANERGAPASKGTKSRKDRLDEPPTWRGSATRALIASALVLVFVIAVLGFSVARLATLVPLLLLYVPLGYYTDLWLYRRRQRQKQGRR
ncbi:MAG: hypothetical protein NVSMB51_20010 [Solirubrobacteraceae bacterium]